MDVEESDRGLHRRPPDRRPSRRDGFGFGFGFVRADHEVAGRGHSEVILGVTAGTEAEVVALADRVRAAGGTVTVEPGDPGWGYQSTVTDLDGHLGILQVR